MSELRELALPLEGTKYAFEYSSHPTPTSARYVFQHTIVFTVAEAKAEITQRIAELRADGTLRLPSEWEELEHVHVLDEDGWRSGFRSKDRKYESKHWDVPITREEFHARVSRSTIEGYAR